MGKLCITFLISFSILLMGCSRIEADRGTVADGAENVNSIIPKIKAIAAGEYHTCAIGDDTSVYCWGYNAYGNLGNNSNIKSTLAVKVKNLTNVVQISVGGNTSCALTSNDVIYCWGDNYHGQLGPNAALQSFSLLPVEVPNVTQTKQISAGAYNTCALSHSGALKCWGNNQKSQLGTPSSAPVQIPVAMNGVSNSVQVIIDYQTACVLTNTNKVNCWGNSNSHGLLGNGTINLYTGTPVETQNITSAVKVDYNFLHACALESSGDLKCWGDGGFGALGNSSLGYASSPVPVTVSGSTQWKDFSVGGYFTCGITINDELKCWGNNSSCALGSAFCDNTLVKSFTPLSVVGGDGAISITAGLNHACSLYPDGIVKCWGDNFYGQSAGSSDVKKVNQPTIVR